MIRWLGFLDVERKRIVPLFLFLGLIPLAESILFLLGGRLRGAFLGTLFLTELVLGVVFGLGIYYSDDRVARDTDQHASDERQERLRVRTLTWGALATDLAVAFLTLLRLFPTLVALLVPSGLFPITEVTVLVLTLAILGLLSSYTANASQFHGSTVAAEVRDLRASLEEKVLPRLDSLVQSASRLARTADEERARSTNIEEARRHSVGVRLRTAKTGWFSVGVFLDISTHEVGLRSGSGQIVQPAPGGPLNSGQVVVPIAEIGVVPRGTTQTLSLFDVGQINPESVLAVILQLRSDDGYSQQVVGQFRLKKSGILTFWFERVD